MHEVAAITALCGQAGLPFVQFATDAAVATAEVEAGELSRGNRTVERKDAAAPPPEGGEDQLFLVNDPGVAPDAVEIFDRDG